MKSKGASLPQKGSGLNSNYFIFFPIGYTTGTDVSGQYMIVDG
jgi:hypothetical protein